MNFRIGRRWSLAAVAALFGAVFSAGASGSDVEAILARSEPPPGVVFEILSSREDELSRALPRIAAYARRLRARFPGLDVSVVTHGREQFSLLSRERASNEAVHTLVETLVADADIDLHVCGTFASWRQMAPEDFPDYVDVAVSAPAKLNDYEALGYVRLRLSPGGE